MDINDVRVSLYNAYRKLADQPGGIEGKMSEGHVNLKYPTYWDSENVADFCEPYGIEIYSYALGPSRSHYILKEEKESHPNYYTWCGPDIFGLAVKVINSWADEIGADEE